MYKLKLLVLMTFVKAATTNVINIAQGRLRGVLHDGYVSYEGIPYGTIAGTKDRFTSAGLAPVWQGVRESYTTSCLSTSDPNECLQLDVHVPLSGSRSWPVLVWVTGGSGHYNPNKLVQRGIILVIVHHRHGPQGFLCLKEIKIPGNVGVKDLVLALKWIRDNIIAFKGNPSHVVLAGQSFGAAMIEAVLMSSIGDGLYHGAILQSGSVLAPWVFNYDAKTRASTLAEIIDSRNDTVSTILNAKIEDLVSKSDELQFPYIPFAICKEIPLKNKETVFVEAPIGLKAKSYKVPLIIGFNSEEAYIFASALKDSKTMKIKSNDMTFLLPEELKFLNEREAKQVSDLIKDIYFASNISMTELLTYHRDAYFMNHVYRSANLHASSNAPVYFYQFSHVGEIGVMPESNMEKSGAAHSDELGYLFPNKDLDEEDGIVQENLLELWCNFVKYLNPTHIGSLNWEIFDSHHRRILDINTEPKMIDFPYTKAAHIWNEIYDKYYYKKNHDVL